MSFTAIFAVLAVLGLIIILGLTYKMRGLKTAVIATSIASIVLVVLFVATIYAIASVMPNLPDPNYLQFKSVPTLAGCGSPRGCHPRKR